jgi:hypothetical protein
MCAAGSIEWQNCNKERLSLPHQIFSEKESEHKRSGTVYYSHSIQHLLPYTPLLIGRCNRNTLCFLRGTKWIFLYSVASFQSLRSVPTFAAEARVRSRSTPCDVYGGQSGSGMGSS